MIVRTLSDTPKALFAGRPRQRTLVPLADDMGYMLSEIGVDADEDLTFAPLLDLAHNTAFYCIQGRGTASVNGIQTVFTPGTMVAADGAEAFGVVAETDMRIAAVACPGEPATGTIVRTLAEVGGSERDIFWGNGRSRRYLVEADGMGFALCNTTGDPGTDSYLEYRDHYESCYYITGSGEYTWDEGHHPILTGTGQGTVFIMNKQDKHHMRIAESAICISVFYPAIRGDECHDFDRDAPSSY